MLPQNDAKDNQVTQAENTTPVTTPGFDIDTFITHLKGKGLLASAQDRARVLVVEDEPDVARSIMFALMQRGIECAHAGDGPDALKKVANFKPHVVLLDLTLPGLDGLDVCLRVKNDDATSQIRVIVVSARATDHDMFFSRQVGADDHVAKPFELVRLVDKVVAQLPKN